MTALPPAFLQLQGFARNDLKQIRKLDKESPVYAVGVLVAIATEALSQLEGRGDDAVFAEDLLGLRHGVPVLVGRVLFDAVRNGLAHAYDTRTVVLGSEEVVVVLSWEQRGHLSVASEDWLRDGKLRRGICLNVGTLWADLDAHFSEFSQRLEQDAELRQRVTDNAAKQKRSVPQGDALHAWRDFLSEQEKKGRRP
jgi:hypothetical protein